MVNRGLPLRHTQRHLQLGATLRGQRPALAGLLLWVALLAVLLAAAPLMLPAPAAGLPTAALQMPLEERGGGDVPPHEQAPMKLRRLLLRTAVPSIDTLQGHAAAPACPAWTLVVLPAARFMPIATDWPTAGTVPPRTDAPGRRQQRGQAPPLA